MRVDGRISRRFAGLRQQGRGGLITFVTAGDPDLGTSMDILRRLPGAGADLIELGMPFSDWALDEPGHLTERGHRVAADTMATLVQGSIPEEWDYRHTCTHAS